jgi:hypothetical protein
MQYSRGMRLWYAVKPPALSSPTVADPHQKPAVRPRRRGRKSLLVFLLVALGLLAAIIYPPSFRFAVRELLAFEAWRYGFHLSIGEIDGSVTEPILLRNARLSHNSDAGTSTMLQIDTASASFAWRHFFWQRDMLVWRDLSVDGVRGTIDLPTDGHAGPKPAASPFRLLGATKPPRLLLPSSLTIRNATIVIRESTGQVRLQDLDLHASDVESGHLVIGAVSVQEPWMTSLFSNCRGALLIQDSKLLLTGMKLSDSLTIASASADLPELLRGRLQMQFALDAFTGSVQGELESGPHEAHILFDGSGTFAHISVAQLAAFLGQDADGLIKDGKFSFHGSPRDLSRATFTTRFEAGDFRWGARKWNSLVAGATYIDQRLQHLDFQLRQAHNSLALNGQMRVPQSWKEWWKTDFSFDVAAKIDNLTELSALLGPGFGDTYGKLTVDGSVSGENASFNGELIVSGSHLSFRKAPLDELQAAIKLQGNEIQVTNAEFTHGDDYLRANGVVNILGEKRYWGTVKASIADLSLYASFLQPPIAPEAFGGGLMLDWSGDGASNAHSGAFTVKLNRIRPLVSGSSDASWAPIDLNAVATYSPQSIFFSNLVLGNGQTTLASRVVANPRSLTLQGLKLSHGKAVWMTGDAQIPLNVWAAWQNPATASWWNFDSPCKLNLLLNRLSVRDTLFLSGRQQGYDGELTGNVHSDGTLAKLAGSGHLTLRDGAAALPGGTLKDCNATIDLTGSSVSLSSADGQWNGTAWNATGTVTAPDVRAPLLNLGVKVPAAKFSLGTGMTAAAALDLHASGAPAALSISGSAQLQTLEINRNFAPDSFVSNGGTGLDGPLPALSLPGPKTSELDVHVGGSGVLRLGGSGTVKPSESGATIEPDLTLGGSITKPALSGKVTVWNLSFFGRTGSQIDAMDTLAVNYVTYYLDAANPGNTALAGAAGGVWNLWRFGGDLVGTLADKHFTWPREITREMSGAVGMPPAPILPLQSFPLNTGVKPPGGIEGWPAVRPLVLPP